MPTPEQEREYFDRVKAITLELSVKRGCSTCKNKKHVANYPGFVMAEEYVCTEGLECDTVLFKVNHCPKWEFCLDGVTPLPEEQDAPET